MKNVSLIVLTISLFLINSYSLLAQETIKYDVTSVYYIDPVNDVSISTYVPNLSTSVVQRVLDGSPGLVVLGDNIKLFYLSTHTVEAAPHNYYDYNEQTKECFYKYYVERYGTYGYTQYNCLLGTVLKTYDGCNTCYSGACTARYCEPRETVVERKERERIVNIFKNYIINPL